MAKLLRPMDSYKILDENHLHELIYPCYGQPKIDGFRGLIHPQIGPTTKTFKPIQNRALFQNLDILRAHGFDFDFEMGVGDPTDGTAFFNATQSVLTTRDAPADDVTIYVFDMYWASAPQMLYRKRIMDLDATLALVRELVPRIEFTNVCTLGAYIENEAAARAFTEEKCSLGYEGVMFKNPNAPYKYGRCTGSRSFIEQALCKLKPLDDTEFRILNWRPLLQNNNAAVVDVRGLAKRGSSKANKIADTLRAGALEVVGCEPGSPWNGITWDIGVPGEALRQDIAMNFAAKYFGRIGTCTFQKYGSKDKPRQPIWKGLRPELEK